MQRLKNKCLRKKKRYLTKSARLWQQAPEKKSEISKRFKPCFQIGSQWCDILSLRRFVFPWANCWYVFRTCLSVTMCACIPFWLSFQVNISPFQNASQLHSCDLHIHRTFQPFLKPGASVHQLIWKLLCVLDMKVNTSFSTVFFIFSCHREQQLLQPLLLSFKTQKIKAWDGQRILLSPTSWIKFLKIWHQKLWGFFLA